MTSIPDPAHILREQHSPLIYQATAESPEAISVILESARPIVFAWAACRTRDHDDAEDITQMVLLKLYSRLPVFRGESRLSTWMFRITLNEIKGLYRSRVREKAKVGVWMNADPPIPRTMSALERIDHQRRTCAVKAAAATLPPLQREVFSLVDLGGMRPCEAARELGRTQTTIRSTLCRARKKIRELVARCHERERRRVPIQKTGGQSRGL